MRQAGFYWVRNSMVLYAGSPTGWHVARWEPDDEDPAEGSWFTTAYKGMCEDGDFDEIGPKIAMPVDLPAA